MKFSAYTALLLPFALLLVLMAAVIVTPRLNTRTHHPAVATTASAVVDLPETRVIATPEPLAATAADTTGTDLQGGSRALFQLRMPYFSFAEDFSLVPGH